MPGKDVHVVRRDGKWAVRKAGADRITRSYGTKQEAIDAARGFAINQGSALYIHGNDGRICERFAYEKDSLQRRNKVA